MAVRVLLTAFILVCGASTAEGSKKFLEDDAKYRTTINNKSFRDDINGMGSMLGCGGQASAQKVASVRRMLQPMWSTLPKTAHRIDRRSLRYLVHRYFMQTSSVMIRGFEPTRPVNEKNWGVADILSQVVPAYVESVLESHHAKNNGFGLDDAVTMVLMLEQLISDSDRSSLERIFQEQRKPVHRSLSHNGLKQVLDHYMVDWMIEGDVEASQMEQLVSQGAIPHHKELVKFIDGRIKALNTARLQRPQKNRGRDIWDMKYSFEDAHEIVAGITQSFQSYWQSECENMKLSLVSMDLQNTGRVPLSKFYGTAIDTDWRFGESEAYLRELGALDESSNWAGPQVIIPNYIQAISNCIVSTEHYLVCCTNDCEVLLGEVEAAVGASTAPPDVILPVVGNMTAHTTIDDDESPVLAGALAEQLEQIAKVHGGKVPLHGRLFAQWLHYVFPRECPFPHKMGTVSAATPGEYGDEHIASEVDMKKHASNVTAASLSASVEKEALHWMSQWSSDEEFIVDYSSELGMPWQRRVMLVIVGLVFLVFGVSGGVIGCSKKAVRPSSAWV